VTVLADKETGVCFSSPEGRSPGGSVGAIASSWPVLV
jgi:hypothetical protein